MWVDVLLLGRKHIYQHPSSTNIYHGSEHDPEGLLGTLTCVFLCWLGVAAGKVTIGKINIYHSFQIDNICRCC